jgi:hypothetical protein
MATQFMPRNLLAAQGYLAIYSHEVDGGIEIEQVPLDFIAVADRQTPLGSKWIDDGLDIVGVTLSEGSFCVANADRNFHGIVRAGATWDECLQLLPSDLRARVVRTEPIAALDRTESHESGMLIS